MSVIYSVDEIAYLNRSRLNELVPQLEVLFLDTGIIPMGLDCLVPAYSRTLFDFYGPSSDAVIDSLRVVQHLRIHKHIDLKDVIQKFVVLIKSQDRQISLRSIYLDISLKDLPSRQVDLVKAVQDLSRVCKAMRIEMVYEDQEFGFGGELRPSEEFSRR